MLAVPSAAPAVTRTIDYGQPGRAQMPAVRGWWNPDGGTLRIPARHVGRTRESHATQTICAAYTLYRFTPQYYQGAWGFDATRHWCERAAPGQRAVFPTWRFSALAYSSYNLNVAVTAISGCVLVAMGILILTGELTELNVQAQRWLSDLGLDFLYKV